MVVPALPPAYTRKMTKEEINRLPVKKWEGPIHLITSDAEVERAVDRYRDEAVLGFDVETKPVFRKGVSHRPALVQLAGEHSVSLFQINRLSSFDTLAALMADSGTIKAGVAPDHDAKQLQAVFPFEAVNFLDLGDVARRLGIESHGLRNLAARLFGFRISKRARCSNWDNRELKPFQVAYAATDAWVSRMIYQTMKRDGLIS